MKKNFVEKTLKGDGINLPSGEVSKGYMRRVGLPPKKKDFGRG